MIKLPVYLAPSNLVLDPHSDEIYMVKSPRSENDDIARRLSRGTESTESKLFPWQKEGGNWRKAIIVNKNPSFEAVSKDRALSITERVSRPTKSSIIRHADDSGAESDSGYGSGLVRRKSFTPLHERLPVPGSNAKPERPILRSESSRRSRTSSSTTNTRNVRFQSPLPMAASRLSSRSASSFDSFRNTPSQASTAESERASSRASRTSVSSEASKASSTPARSSPTRDSGKVSPAKPPRSPTRLTRSNSSSSRVSPSSANSVTSSVRSGSSSRQSPTSRDKENASPNRSSNKNMEMVLNYFSKLPPVV